MSHNALSEYQQLQEETSKLLGCVGGSLIDLCQGPPSEEHAAAYVAIDEQIQKFFTAYYDLRKRHELSKLSVAVLALTKSGGYLKANTPALRVNCTGTHALVVFIHVHVVA